MNVLILFPKAQCYFGKSLDTQRIYKNVFTSYINLLRDNNCTVNYLLEDKLAEELLADYPEDRKKRITAYCKVDAEFLSKFDDGDEFTPEMFCYHDTSECIAGDISKEIPLPADMMSKGRENFINVRTKICKKRWRTVVDRYILNNKAVLLFRADNNLDRCTPLSESISQGDGRLCIEVHFNRGGTTSYYGGVYIPEDFIPSILSL